MQSQNRVFTCPSYRFTFHAADSLICERKKDKIAKQNSTRSLFKREKHRLAVLQRKCQTQTFQRRKASSLQEYSLQE